MIVLGVILILAGFKMIKISSAHKKDWQHWDNIKGSDMSTKAHTYYVVSWVIGFALCIIGALTTVAGT